MAAPNCVRPRAARQYVGAADDGRDRARSAVAGRDFPFVRPTNGLTTGHNKRGCAESVPGIGEV